MRPGAEAPDQLTVQTATGDKGCCAVGELQALRQEAIKTVIGDPVRNRRMDKLQPDEQRAVKAAERSTHKQLWQSAFCVSEVSILSGALRTSWTAAGCGGRRCAVCIIFRSVSNWRPLSIISRQLMRKLCGVGTPKRWAAMGRSAAGAFLNGLVIDSWSLMAALLKTKESEEQNHPTWLPCSLKVAA